MVEVPKRIDELTELTPLADADWIAVGINSAEAKKISPATLKSYVSETPDGEDVTEVVGALPSLTPQEVVIKGGLNRSIDDATGDIPTTISAWIENEKYGRRFQADATAVSGEFDTTVKRTGDKTLKFSNTDITGRCHVDNLAGGASTLSAEFEKGLIKLKSSTKYKVTVPYKTVNRTSGALVAIGEYNSSLSRLSNNTYLIVSGTNDWSIGSFEFTTASTTIGCYLRFQNWDGAIEDNRIDINGVKFEEVYELEADTIVGENESVVGVKAVSSYDSVDQSLDPSGAYANTYTTPTSISETATELQTFTPTKTSIYSVKIWVVAKGTGDLTLTVHDSSNKKLSDFKITNANVVAGAFNEFIVPCLCGGGNIHFHVTSTVADATIKTDTASDLESSSYLTQYRKGSNGIKISEHGEDISIKSNDSFGFMNTQVFDVKNGKMGLNIDGISGNYYAEIVSEIYSGTGGGSAVDQGYRINDAGEYAVFLIRSPFAIKNLSICLRLHGASGYLTNIQFSSDNVNRSTLLEYEAGNNSLTPNIPVPQADGLNLLYIRVIYVSGGGAFLRGLFLDSDIDVVSQALTNFQTASDHKFAMSVQLASDAKYIYYHESKYGYPTLEFQDTNNVVLSHIPMPIDTTDATNSSTTTYLQYSDDNFVTYEDRSGATAKAGDGEYITLATATNTPTFGLNIQIDKNKIYLSSNAEESDAEVDASLQAKALIILKTQGLKYQVRDLTEQVKKLTQIIETLTVLNPA